jgi:PEP-CTERM motif-containing protein
MAQLLQSNRCREQSFLLELFEKMKRLYGFTAAVVLGLGVVQPSWAIMITEAPYDGTDVGSTDTVVDTEQLQNSGQAELAWLQGLLPGATILPQEQDVVYYGTDTANIYAFLLDPAADYFMIKNATWHALFANNASSAWAVFDTSLLPSDFNLGGDGFTISHVRSINPTSTSVPEPAPLALFGLGILGVAVARRRKQI